MEKRFNLHSDIHELASLRSQVRDLLDAAGFDEKAINDVLLAVQEAVTNVIRHGYKDSSGKIELVYKEEPSQVQISIKDYGKKFDLTKVKDPDLPRETPGGLGIYLIKSIMDKVNYDDSFREGNLIHLYKFKSNIRQS